MRLTDVVVVGGGPAGAAAALTLARSGHAVTLVDKARFPRDKACGDGITTGALRLLEGLGLDPGAVPSWGRVDDVVVRGPSGREARFAFPAGAGTFAAVVPRLDLDAAVLDLARVAGVHVADGHALVAARIRSDRVIVKAAGLEPIHARYVVGADGMWSPLRRLLGAAEPGYRGESHAFRQYFTGVGPEAATHLYVWFDPDLLPGYAWSFPLPGGRANVGFGIHRGTTYSVRDMARVWPEILARPHVRAVLGDDARAQSPHRSWPVPARVGGVRLTAGGGRALFTGDAAAATDPMTGEGIGQALLSGIRAAEAIEAGGPYRPDVAARHYQGSVRRELVPDHRVSSALLALLRSPHGADAALAMASASPWIRERFLRWLFEDEPRGVALTPRRWHSRFLARPGAYLRP